MSPYGLQNWHVLLRLAGDPGLPDPATLPVHQILEFGPLVIIAGLLASSSPLLPMFPLGHEDDTPDHDGEGVEGVGGTVFGCKVEEGVDEGDCHSDDGWEDEPALEETYEVEVGLQVCT